MKNKLLVGGDSFGVTDDLINNPVCVEYNFTYFWHCRWAETVDCDYKNIAVGGTDIYTGTYNAIAEIENDNSITHCLYFVTDFERDAVQPGNTAEEKFQHKVARDHYILYEKPAPEAWDLFRLHSPYEPGSDTYTYYSHIPKWKTYHSGLACISLLDSFCVRHNVKLMLVHTYFDMSTMLIEDAKNILQCEHFNYRDALKYDWPNQDSELRNIWPAHMNPQEIDLIYNHITQAYLKWL